MIWYNEEVSLSDNTVVILQGNLNRISSKFTSTIDLLYNNERHNLFEHVVISREDEPEAEDVLAKYHTKLKKLVVKINKLKVTDIPEKLPKL